MYRAVKFHQMYASDGTSLTALHSDRATFLNFTSSTGTAAELKRIAMSLGLPFHKKSVRVTGRPDSYMPRTVRVIELVEREVSPWPRRDEVETWPVYLAWLEVPEIDGLPLRTIVSDEVTDDEIDAMRCIGSDYEVGVGQFGDDEEGNAVIALSSHAFYAVGPTLGYTVKAMCALYGGTEDSITFDDQVFYCGGCYTLQEDSTGYEYRYREIGGELYGTACGCAGDAELDNLDDFIGEPDKALSSDGAAKLVEQGRIEHVARYIGGWTDPGRGGWYDGERVENGQPDEVLAKLQAAEPNSEFVCGMDECGQFQVYWSVYRVVAEKVAVAL